MASKSSVRELKKRCHILEGHNLRHRFVTEEELAAYRPGGEDNPDKGQWGWVKYFAQLTRFAGREEMFGSGGDNESADAITLDSLRAEPVEVILTPQSDGTQRKATVHPKSLDALLSLHARDWMLDWLATRYHFLKQRDDPGDAELVLRLQEELSFQYRVLIWTVTHPGPRKPFDSDYSTLEPPEWTLDYTPEDCLGIARGHMRANGQRLAALEVLITPRANEESREKQRPSWSVFVGSMSLKMGIPARQLMRDHSLGELVSMVRVGTPEPPKPSKERGEEELGVG